MTEYAPDFRPADPPKTQRERILEALPQIEERLLRQESATKIGEEMGITDKSLVSKVVKEAGTLQYIGKKWVRSIKVTSEPLENIWSRDEQKAQPVSAVDDPEKAAWSLENVDQIDEEDLIERYSKTMTEVARHLDQLEGENNQLRKANVALQGQIDDLLERNRQLAHKARKWDEHLDHTRNRQHNLALVKLSNQLSGMEKRLRAKQRQ